MQVFQNSSPVFLRNNSFLENKILKNENKEERTQSNISLRNNNSILSGQENESPFGLNDEDSNNIFWHDINDFSEESTPFSINLNEKSLFDKNSSIINQSNIIEDNISIEKIEKSFSLSQNKDIINESNENEIEIFGFTHKLNEDAEKISGLSGDSFISIDSSPNQDYIIVENDFAFNNLMMDEGKNDSFYNNIKEPMEEMKEKLNISENSENADKKKEKVNFLISKTDTNNLMNIENNNNNDNSKNNNDDKKKSKFFKNEYIGKKRDIEKKVKDPIQITKNTKLTNLHEINKVTIISPKAFKCECGKVFSTEENQRLHYINIHLHEKPYNCSFCGEGFSHRNGKIYHERVYHTFIFPYPCKECCSAFASKSAMIYHMKSKHKIINK